MREASLVGHVREVLVRFLSDPTLPADQHLREFYRARRYLGSRDRRSISRDYYLTIRLFRSYQRALFPDSSEGELPSPDSVPYVLMRVLIDHVDYEAAEIRNGCFGDESESQTGVDSSQLPGLIHLVDAHGFPEWLVAELEREFGDRTPGLLNALNEEAEPELRVRATSAESIETVVEEMAKAGASDIRTSTLVPGGISIGSRINLGGVSAVRSGKAVVQSLASQLVGHLVDAGPGDRVFDGCAGAGGKSIQMADMIGSSGEVVAWDISADRLGRLKKRVERMGLASIRAITDREYQHLLQELAGTFDAVLIDAPCSGTGTIRRNPGLKLTLLPGDVEALTAVQLQLIREQSRLVRSGGHLIYATCSLLRRENQGIVESFLAEEGEAWRIEDASDFVDAGIVTTDGYLQTDPDSHDLDGFFAARLVRVRTL